MLSALESFLPIYHARAVVFDGHVEVSVIVLVLVKLLVQSVLSQN